MTKATRAAALLACLVCTPAFAQEDANAKCLAAQAPDDMISLCTTALTAEGPVQLALVLRQRAQGYVLKHDFADATKDIEQITAMIPMDPTSLLLLGNIYRASGNFERAIDSYTKALALQPNYVAALINRGRAFAGLKNFPAAIQDLERALALEPRNFEAQYDLAAIQNAAGQNDEALQSYTKVLGMNPTVQIQVLALIEHGRILAEQGHFQEGMSDFDKAEILKQNDPTLLNSRCWARAVANQQLDQALADCQQSLALAPGNSSIEDSLAFVYFRKGDFANARTFYDAALAGRPESASSLFMRGVVRHKQGDAAGGDADIAAANASDPTIAARFAGYGVTP